jgi:hypothetical protein
MVAQPGENRNQMKEWQASREDVARERETWRANLKVNGGEKKREETKEEGEWE